MEPTLGLPKISATAPSLNVTSMGHRAEHISHWLYLIVSIENNSLDINLCCLYSISSRRKKICQALHLPCAFAVTSHDLRHFSEVRHSVFDSLEDKIRGCVEGYENAQIAH